MLPDRAPPPEIPLPALTVRDVGTLVLSATVMLAEPLNDTPLIVRAVCRVVAVEALPVRAAVIVPAEKLPEASRATTLEAVLAEVASTPKV